MIFVAFNLSSCGGNNGSKKAKTTQITTTYTSERSSNSISDTHQEETNSKEQTVFVSTGSGGISFILSPIDLSSFYVVELQLEQKFSDEFKLSNGTLSSPDCIIQSYHSGTEAYLTSDTLPCRYLQLSYVSSAKRDGLTKFSETLYYKKSGVNKYYCIKTSDHNKYMLKIAFSSFENDLKQKLEFFDQEVQIHKTTQTDSPAEYSKTVNDVLVNILNTKYGLFITKSQSIDFFSNNLIGITKNNHSYTVQLDPNDDLSVLYGTEQTHFEQKDFSAFKLIDEYYVDVIDDDDKLILRIKCENANSTREALWNCIQDVF